MDYLHSTKNIISENYEFIAIQVYAQLDDDAANEFNRENACDLQNHKATSNGKIAKKIFKGSCHVCGAHAVYLATFYHADTNEYIEVGSDCCEKINICVPMNAFNKFKKGLASYKDIAAGKTKAQALLADNNLTQAWKIYQEMAILSKKSREDINPNTLAMVTIHCQEFQSKSYEYKTIYDIVSKLVKYGKLSDKQISFLNKLILRSKETKTDLPTVPTGRLKLEGIVFKTKQFETDYGTQYKMTVLLGNGSKVYGTIPKAILADTFKGVKVVFTATVDNASDNSSMGFYSRPSKAVIVK